MRTSRDIFASPISSPPSVHFAEMDTAKISATPVQTETLLNTKAGDISDSGTGISGLIELVSMDSNTSSMKSPVKFTMSAEEVDNFLQIKNEEFALHVLPAMVFLGVLFIIGVLGNSLVLYVYNRKLRKGSIRWFIQALALFDLFSCLVAIPGEVFDMLNNYTFGVNPMCKILRTVNMFCTVASGMTLMVVAVERYKRICTPLRKQITPKGAKIIMVCCVIASVVCATPAALIYGKQTTPTDHPEINGGDCSTSDGLIGTVYPLVFSLFQFLLFVFGALGLIVLYVLICRRILTHSARFRPNLGFNSLTRRTSYIFTGSECSSPTTDDAGFTFKSDTKEEANSNSSNGNNNNNDDDDVLSKLGANTRLAPAEFDEPAKPPSHQSYDRSVSYEEDRTLVTAIRKSVDAECAILPKNQSFLKVQLRGDRRKSGDPLGAKGRYRRQSSVRTNADIRRFINRSESVNSGTRQTTLMLFLITLVYLLSFLPYLVLMILKVLDRDSLSGGGGSWEVAHNILLRSYFINSMANPIIYSFCSRRFRGECSKVLHCKCCEK